MNRTDCSGKSTRFKFKLRPMRAHILAPNNHFCKLCREMLKRSLRSTSMLLLLALVFGAQCCQDRSNAPQLRKDWCLDLPYPLDQQSSIVNSVKQTQMTLSTNALHSSTLWHTQMEIEQHLKRLTSKARIGQWLVIPP